MRITAPAFREHGDNASPRKAEKAVWTFPETAMCNSPCASDQGEHCFLRAPGSEKGSLEDGKMEASHFGMTTIPRK